MEGKFKFFILCLLFWGILSCSTLYNPFNGVNSDGQDYFDNLATTTGSSSNGVTTHEEVSILADGVDLKVYSIDYQAGDLMIEIGNNGTDYDSSNAGVLTVLMDGGSNGIFNYNLSALSSQNFRYSGGKTVISETLPLSGLHTISAEIGTESLVPDVNLSNNIMQVIIDI